MTVVARNERIVTGGSRFGNIVRVYGMEVWRGRGSGLMTTFASSNLGFNFRPRRVPISFSSRMPVMLCCFGSRSYYLHPKLIHLVRLFNISSFFHARIRVKRVFALSFRWRKKNFFRRPKWRSKYWRVLILSIFATRVRISRKKFLLELLLRLIAISHKKIRL